MITMDFGVICTSRGSTKCTSTPCGSTSVQRRTRDGFTLLEVILAIALTALALGVAGSALAAALDVRDRVRVHRDTVERDVQFRSMLADMLRHAPRAEAVDEPLMHVEQSPDGARALVFLSTGVRPPFGTGAMWRVTLAERSEGVTLDAVTIGSRADGSALHTQWTSGETRAATPTAARSAGSESASASSLHVAFLEQAGGGAAARWRSDWPLAQTRPSMIAIRLDSGRPLVVALDPLSAAGAWP